MLSDRDDPPYADAFDEDAFSKDAFDEDAFSKDAFDEDAFSKDAFDEDAFSKDAFDKDTFSVDAFRDDEFSDDALSNEVFCNDAFSNVPLRSVSLEVAFAVSALSDDAFVAGTSIAEEPVDAFIAEVLLVDPVLLDDALPPIISMASAVSFVPFTASGALLFSTGLMLFRASRNFASFVRALK